MVDLATLRVLEFGIGDVLNLDFSWLGVDDATISAHDKPLCAGERVALMPASSAAIRPRAVQSRSP